MGTISSEALIGLLMLILVVLMFNVALKSVSERSIYTSDIKMLEGRAAGTSALTAIYTYSLRHGSFNAELGCLIGGEIVCIDGKGNNATSVIYRRMGAGD